MGPSPQLTRLEIYNFDAEGSEERIIGVAMTGFVPLPGTLFHLLGRSALAGEKILTRVFRVEQTVTMLMDQTRGYPDMGTNMVKIIAKPLGPAQAVDPAILQIHHPEPFTPEQIEQIQREAYGAEN